MYSVNEVLQMQCCKVSVTLQTHNKDKFCGFPAQSYDIE